MAFLEKTRQIQMAYLHAVIDQWSLDSENLFKASEFPLRVITVFTVIRLLTDFVCLYNYEFGLSLCKIVRSSVILLLPLFGDVNVKNIFTSHIDKKNY